MDVRKGGMKVGRGKPVTPRPRDRTGARCSAGTHKYLLNN